MLHLIFEKTKLNDFFHTEVFLIHVCVSQMSSLAEDSSIAMVSVLLLWMGSGVQAVEANSRFAGSATNLTHKVNTGRVLLNFYVQCLFYFVLLPLICLGF